jgi:nucleoside-diphosphate-sugar epimerase
MSDSLLNHKFIITGVNGWIGRALIHKLYECFGSNLQSKVVAFSSSSSSIILKNGFELKTYQYQDNIKYSGNYILCHFAFLTMDKVKLMNIVSPFVQTKIFLS